MQELRQALAQFMEQLSKQAEGQPPMQGMDRNREMMTQQDLEQMLRNLENMARSGNRDMAQQMLSQLRDLLDRLQSGRMADQGQSQRFGKMMDEFGDIIGQQQQLLDDTFRQQRQKDGQRGQKGQQGQQGQQARGTGPAGQGQGDGDGTPAASTSASASCATGSAGCSGACGSSACSPPGQLNGAERPWSVPSGPCATAISAAARPGDARAGAAAPGCPRHGPADAAPDAVTLSA